MSDPKHELPGFLEDHLSVPKPVVETLCKLMESLLGEPCKAGGDLLADQIRSWQWGNRFRILEKFRTKYPALVLAPESVPRSFSIPFLDACGNVDDDELQDLWANLLKHSTESERNASPRLIGTLRKLSKPDAQLLRDIAEGKRYRGHEVPEVENLLADGLVVASVHVGEVETATRRATPPKNIKGEIKLTGYGKSFYEACAAEKVQPGAVEQEWLTLGRAFSSQKIAFKATFG